MKCHFKIPPTVFYPQPKVNSALIGVHFLSPKQLRQRLCGVQPKHIRIIVTQAFQQRRKTLRNSLKKLAIEICNGNIDQVQILLNSKPLSLPSIVKKAQENGDIFALQQQLPDNWSSKRPEELTSGQFVELTRLFYGPSSNEIDDTTSITDYDLGTKVWRKLKHGKV